jgi:hypothetical protein
MIRLFAELLRHYPRKRAPTHGNLSAVEVCGGLEAPGVGARSRAICREGNVEASNRPVIESLKSHAIEA